MRTSVIIAIDPCLTHGLGSFYRPNIMRLSVIIPRNDFYQIYLVANIDQRLPPSSVQVLIAEVDPLQELVSLQHVQRESNRRFCYKLTGHNG
jgi:hypothetical protein